MEISCSDGQLDLIYELVDHLSWACHYSNNWDSLNSVLEMNPARIGSCMSIALLTLTLKIKFKLTNRSNFYQKCEDLWGDSPGLLDGLK